MLSRETFGELIRNLREKKGLPLRKVAAFLDIDPSTLSKIERNERMANRDYVKKLSELFEVDERMLTVNYLSDRVTYELVNEELSNEVLKVAEEKIKYLRAKNTQQSKLSF
jgi:HTH-type transcriptional regulator, competence development regulator